MSADSPPLIEVYRGWDGYQTSLVHALNACSPNDLQFRPVPHLRSVGEIFRHIIEGRVDWFHRTFGVALISQAMEITGWQPEQRIQDSSEALLKGLNDSWEMIEDGLTTWRVADLGKMFPITYQGTACTVSRQWILWHIMSHDIHHGGELAVMLGSQEIDIPELGGEGGHLTPPIPEG